MTQSHSTSEVRKIQHPPYLFIQLTQGDGKVHPQSQTAETVRYYLADRKKRNRMITAALLQDPSVRRISTGWRKFEEAGSVASSTSDSDNDMLLDDASVGQPMACSGRQLECLLALYVQTVVPVARGFSRQWKWCDDMQHIKSIPMLAYATAAYTSAFLMVFSPEDQEMSGLWLDLETKAVSWLRRALETGASRGDWAPTMALLMRLAWLLEDSETGQMHAHALQQMLVSSQSPAINMETERRFVAESGRAQVAKLLHARDAIRA